jgi:hypothetical protein
MLSRSAKTAQTATGSASPNKAPNKPAAEYEESETMPLLSQLQQRLGAFKVPKMPWVRNEASNDVYELSDLPKLRTQDAHPDTPRRRPISAATDFGDIGLDGKQVYVPDVPLPRQSGLTATRTSDFSDTGAMESEVAVQKSFDEKSFDEKSRDMPFSQDRDIEFAPTDFGPSIDFENATFEKDTFESSIFETNGFETNAFETEAFEQEDLTQEFVASQPDHIVPATEFAADQPIEPKVATAFVEAPAMDDTQPSLAELVAKFEAAVARRTEQLAALESLATRLASQTDAAAEFAADAAAPENAAAQPPVEFQPAAATLQPQEFETVKQTLRPPLEAVPSAKRNDSDDDMDAALNAALATLQRMNAK